ncbi:hypothetical protein BC940DRAFT_297799 [Gongronella butleri]|nr:hypothetical protein BC940DRAFT_297799 [Gongronella butleri]
MIPVKTSNNLLLASLVWILVTRLGAVAFLAPSPAWTLITLFAFQMILSFVMMIHILYLLYCHPLELTRKHYYSMAVFGVLARRCMQGQLSAHLAGWVHVAYNQGAASVTVTSLSTVSATDLTLIVLQSLDMLAAIIVFVYFSWRLQLDAPDSDGDTILAVDECARWGECTNCTTHIVLQNWLHVSQGSNPSPRGPESEQEQYATREDGQDTEEDENLFSDASYAFDSDRDEHFSSPEEAF